MIMSKVYKNLQEVFDTAVAGLASQGFAISWAGAQCAYRGPHGRKCPIGWCIPDEIYSPDLEGTSINALMCGRDSHQKILDLFCYIDNYSLIELQRCHDEVAQVEILDIDKPELLRANLFKFAKRFHLILPRELLSEQELQEQMKLSNEIISEVIAEET
jgi:hypothetical protein